MYGGRKGSPCKVYNVYIETVNYHSPYIRREQVVTRDEETIPAIVLLYDTHRYTYLSLTDLHSNSSLLVC
jgi:hypothetical protein